MENFAVRLELGHTIIVSKHRIMFDAVLAAMHFQIYEDRNLATEELPLRKNSEGVVYGSQMYYEVADNMTEINVGYVSSVERTLHNHELIHCAPRFMLDGGNNRHPLQQNTIDVKKALPLEAVWFFGQGDLENVLKLCQHLHHVGPKRTNGFGRIKSMEVLSVNNNENGIYDPNMVVMRPVPLNKLSATASRRGIDVMDDNWMPPYHLPGTRTVCAVPRNQFLKPELVQTMVGDRLHYQKM